MSTSCPVATERRRLLQGMALAALSALWRPSAAAPLRLSSALLFGNASYRNAPLRNPANDARALERSLQRLGFSTQLEVDAGYGNMLEQLRNYLRKAARSNVRLVFFAGHGVQWQGRNYLVPVDADIHDEDDLASRCIDLTSVVDRLSALRDGVNLIIVDACRNNPFVPTVGALADARRLRSRGIMADPGEGSGLAPVSAPSGTLVAFSTAPGAISVDSPEARNSIYTALLIEHIATPGLPVERLFKEIRAEVARRTEQKQVPWESSSLMGDFCFLPGPRGQCGS